MPKSAIVKYQHNSLKPEAVPRTPSVTHYIPNPFFFNFSMMALHCWC